MRKENGHLILEEHEYNQDVIAFIEEFKGRMRNASVEFNEDEITVYVHGPYLYVMPVPIEETGPFAMPEDTIQIRGMFKASAS